MPFRIICHPDARTTIVADVAENGDLHLAGSLPSEKLPYLNAVVTHSRALVDTLQDAGWRSVEIALTQEADLAP